MPALYVSETTDPELLKLPKYRIGDRMRITQVQVGDPNNYDPETLKAFEAIRGRVLTIKEIELWEAAPPHEPFFVTYEFYIAHLTGHQKSNRNSSMETVYLTADEIEPVQRRPTRSAGEPSPP